LAKVGLKCVSEATTKTAHSPRRNLVLAAGKFNKWILPMTGVMSILEFVAQTKAIEHDLHELGPAIVARACELVAKQAKRAIGKTHELWPPLKLETIARKLNGNTPLLETGELRDSIEWTAHGLEGSVGSNSDKAVWQELGTKTIPPRSEAPRSELSPVGRLGTR
jgi:hypothetical protein